MWICKRYNWRWRSARFSWVAEKLSIFVGTEQTAVVLYIGGFRHQSWLRLGGAENNGLHIFHCISIALYLCISSLCDLYLYVFCNCICIYIPICVGICICILCGCRGVRENNGPNTATQCIAKLVTVTPCSNTSLHLKPFPTNTHFLLHNPKTLDSRDIRGGLKQKHIVVHMCAL